MSAFIFKQPNVLKRYSFIRVLFSTLFGVWKCDQTNSFLFDIFTVSGENLVADLNDTCLIITYVILFSCYLLKILIRCPLLNKK